ncbi:MAG: hypothetical protein JKY65_29975 [Planctomycetes bacterium]|nr:hypothetical protein [Planctomycetota bacterium]
MTTPAEASPEAEIDDQPAACPIPVAKKGLTGFEKAELLLIGVALTTLFALTQDLDWTLPFGTLVAYGAGLLLGHGLIRDLARLAIKGRKTPTQSLLCLCAESMIGVAALGAGLSLLAIGIRDTVTLTPVSLTAIAAGILALGFLAKDYVLVLRKVTDHGSISIG